MVNPSISLFKFYSANKFQVILQRNMTEFAVHQQFNVNLINTYAEIHFNFSTGLNSEFMLEIQVVLLHDVKYACNVLNLLVEYRFENVLIAASNY